MGLRVERHDRAAVLVFDWPERRNAIGPEEALEITATLKDIVKDPAVCGVVITGEGAFCAGGNLKGAVFKQDTSTEERSAAVYGAVHGMMQAIVNVPLPTVAAIDGPAIALGFDMALACDSRFIGPKGWCLQCSPFSVTKDLMIRSAELAEKLNLGESSGESTARERAIARVNALAPMSRETLEAYVDLNRADLRSKMEHGLAAAAAKQLALLTRPGLEDRVKAALNK